MAMRANFSNANAGLPAGQAAAARAGTWAPRRMGMFNVARKAGNARSGEYARQARAFMRSEGIECYKVLTPGSLRVGEVVEVMSQTAGITMALDQQIARLIESWEQQVMGFGTSGARKVFVKQDGGLKTMLNTEDMAAAEGVIKMGDGKQVGVELVKQHLGGTDGVPICCITGPEKMIGRNELKAARATEILYKMVEGSDIDPGPNSFEISNSRVTKDAGVWGFMLYSCTDKQFVVREMLKKVVWHEVAAAWGVPGAGTMDSAEYMKKVEEDKKAVGIEMEKQDELAPRTVMIFGITEGLDPEALKRQMVVNLMKVGMEEEEARRSIESCTTQEAQMTGNWYGRVVCNSQEAASNMLKSEDLLDRSSAHGEGGIGGMVRFYRGRTAGQRKRQAVRMQPEGRRVEAQGEVRVQGFEQFKAEEVLQQFKEILKERDEVREAEMIRRTVGETMAVALGRGSQVMQQFEAQLKEAVKTVTIQATNLMRDIADYELVPEQTHATTVNELFRLAEAQQTQEKAQPVYRHPVGRDQNGVLPNSGMEGEERLGQSQQSMATQQVQSQGGGMGLSPAVPEGSRGQAGAENNQVQQQQQMGLQGGRLIAESGTPPTGIAPRMGLAPRVGMQRHAMTMEEQARQQAAEESRSKAPSVE